jgi:hypothetical protein
MIYIDAHVHIYGCYNPGAFFNAACSNFDKTALANNNTENWQGVLWLTETDSEHWFETMESSTEAHRFSMGLENWVLQRTAETSSVILKSPRGHSLFLMAGQQVVTSEDLEVLAVGTRHRFPKQPLDQVILAIKAKGAIAVIPWGFGKWIRRRGQILENYLCENRGSGIYLGDNGGRPGFLPFPKRFVACTGTSSAILPGSDSLPFSRESDRAGSRGFSLPGFLNTQYPVTNLIDRLQKKSTPVLPFGKPEKAWRFLINQFAMQYLKRFSRN